MAAVQPENKIQEDTLLAGKYRVTRELGRGGMAAVYEAENVDVGKRIAIKVLAAELANSAVVIERFIREARAAASVKSPYIVEVYDSGRLEDGRPFIAMELLEGESLYDRMARVRLMDVPSTVRTIGQVAKGLTKAHAIGIVHRDLKPENIHLCKGEDGEEVAKILDFGLAKFYSPVETDEKSARLTREGAVFGTPAYMSPEQVKGQGNVDFRADLWAVGCMAYECLTGRPVWNTDQGVAMTFAAIASSQLPMPSRLRPDLPPAFDTWFKKALERDPNRRFQTAKELAEELAKALDSPPISLVSMGGATSSVDLDAVANLREVRSAQPSSRALAPGLPLPPADGFPAARVSEPIDLLKAPDSALGGTNLVAGEPAPTSAPRRRGRLGGVVVALGVLGACAGGAWFAFPKVRARFWPARGAVAVAPVGDPSASGSASRVASAPDRPKWLSTVEEGQELLTSGDMAGALGKFKDAVDEGGNATAHSMLDQAKLGAALAGSCKMASLSHPRVGYSGSAGRPAVAATSKGTVVAWTDDHEQPGHDHVYSVLVDAAGRPTSSVRDLTPEAEGAMRPELMTVGDRVVLLFWDRMGRQPGIKARWLDADGRIGAMSVDVGASKSGIFWPSIDRAPDGNSFWVAWQANPDKEGGKEGKDGDDIFLRRLDANLVPQGSEVRATAYDVVKGKSVKAGVPSVAVTASNLYVSYSVERDRQFVVERMRLPLSSPELQANGLEEKAGGKAKHELGDTVVVNEDKAGGDYPSLACTKDACFLAWHETDRGGALAAFIDPAKGTILWRKRFAPRGGHPAVAIGPDGRAEVAFYEGGRVRIAPISRDGVGTAETFGKTTGDQPRAWIAPGLARGEWLVSWLDMEAGHTEPFFARLQCRN